MRRRRGARARRRGTGTEPPTKTAPALRTRAALSDDAIVVYEHASAANDEVEEAAKARDLSIAQRKKYGDTVVDVLRATALHDAID